MYFQSNDEEKMLQSSINEFSESELKPISQEYDRTENFNIEIIKKIADMGLLGMTIPENYGGIEMSYLSYCIALEEISRINCSFGITVASANTLGIEPIYNFCNGDQRANLLEKLCTGQAIATGLFLEKDIEINDLDGDLSIHGEKHNVINACNELSKIYNVLIYKNDSVIFAILPAGIEGCKVEKIHDKLGLRAADITNVKFNNCIVNKSSIVDKRSGDISTYYGVLDNYKLAIAAIALGACKGAFEVALKYTKERLLFGKPVCSFQVNAFKLADMSIKIETARNVLYNACKLKDSNQEYSKEATIAKIYCLEAMGSIADESVQLLGAYGLSTEYDVERFYRDYKALIHIGKSLDNEKDYITKLLGCLD